MKAKRLMALLLAAVLMMALVACGGEKPAKTEEETATQSSEVVEEKEEAAAEAVVEEEVSEEVVEEVNAIELNIGDCIDNDRFKMTFDSVEVLPEYSYATSEYSSMSLYVEEGYKLVLLKGHFENKSTAAITDTAFSFTATVNDEYEVDGYDVRLNFIRDKYFEADAYTDVDYVLYINIPNKLADMFEKVNFTIAFNDDMSTLTTVWNMDGTKTVEADQHYSITSGAVAGETAAEAEAEAAGPAEETKQTMVVGDTVTTDEYTFTLTAADWTYELLPTDTSSVYTSYPAESGKVYVHVAADLTNLMKRDIRIDETFNVTAVYGADYTYKGFVVVDTGNSFDWVSSYSAATPLETAKMHALIECPELVAESTEPLSVIITLSNGVEYTCVIR